MFDFKTFAGNLVMLQDHPLGATHANGTLTYAITSFGSARPFWTLAIEWWIYMCFGWVVLRREKPGVLWLVVFVPLAIVPAYNSLGGRGNGLALVWMFGATTFLLARSLAAARRSILVGAALVFGALSLVVLHQTHEPYDVKYGALLATAMLCAVLAVDRVRWRVPPVLARAIRFVANYSFTLYLLHYTIIDLLAHHPPFASPTASFAVAVVCANAASIAVAYFTEFRHRAFAAWLKRRFA